ncbi:sn-glycerol-3-phosphate ABC transporter ATP-binding protein UgpC [Gordonia sp. VNQ95]|uniref:ABC transporter ATP-binding protein n=1 Tax=Gordonia TaxID=2053 RepID=UPI0032B587F4
MASITFDAVTRQFLPDAPPAVDALDLDIGDGEFMVLVGPSGCGKSTTLRMLAGLEPVESGRILIDGADVSGKAPRERDVAMVFQNYALYPNMSVAQNMGFALRNAGMSKADTQARVLDVARMLELESLLGRKPAKLSGGQRQRVAMGRAIVRRPRVFCMDEPLSNLDAKLRVSTRAQIAALQRELGTTTLYVTHDQVEAMTMGHRVAVLDHGVLQQVGTPREIYRDPVNMFVAGFMGSPQMCLVDVERDGSAVALGDATIAAPPGAPARVTVGLRAQAWRVGPVHEPETVRARVELVEELGAEQYIYCSAEVTPRSGRVVVRADHHREFAVGDELGLTPLPEEMHWFDTATGTRI